jgi:DNA-directed RNA polymerase specialized sigma24 family protein
MENVSDVQALAASIVTERRRGSSYVDLVSDGSRGSASSIDYEDALGHVVEAIVAARAGWDPARNPSFLSYATWKGRNALSDWFRGTLGRDTPKAHAWAVPLDVGDPDDDEDVRVFAPAAVALAEGSIPHAVLALSDPEIAETLVRVVVPLAEGYSLAEVAEMLGETEYRVSARMRRLRARRDLLEIA